MLAGVLVALALVEIGGEGDKRGEDLREDPARPGRRRDRVRSRRRTSTRRVATGEHPEEVRLAIDGNPTGTSWLTETYTASPRWPPTARPASG